MIFPNFPAVRAISVADSIQNRGEPVSIPFAFGDSEKPKVRNMWTEFLHDRKDSEFRIAMLFISFSSMRDGTTQRLRNVESNLCREH